MTLRLKHVADKVVARLQIALHASVARVVLRQRLHDGEAAAIGDESVIKMALCREHVADPLINSGQFLPLTGVIQSERLIDRERVAIGGECLVKIPLLFEDIADPYVALRQITLPKGVVEFLLRQLLGNVRPFAVSSERLVESPLRQEHVANPIVDLPQITLPINVVWVGLQHRF